MFARSLVTIMLLALCAFSAIMASPPPPFSTAFSVTSPKVNAVYKVGQDIPVKISLVNGTSSALYKSNPRVSIYLQKNIPMPEFNVIVGTLDIRTLYKSGFKFPVKSQYLIKQQANVPFRVRVSYDAGFNDSPSIKLVE